MPQQQGRGSEVWAWETSSGSALAGWAFLILKQLELAFRDAADRSEEATWSGVRVQQLNLEAQQNADQVFHRPPKEDLSVPQHKLGMAKGNCGISLRERGGQSRPMSLRGQQSCPMPLRGGQSHPMLLRGQQSCPVHLRGGQSCPVPEF